MMSLELTIITVQAARGVPSHFNASTPLNVTLFTIMGAAIVVVTVALGYLVWLSFRQPLASFRTPAVGWGVRMGFLTMLVGASLGGLMPGPTAEQRRHLQAGEPPTMLGAHAVGVPDGGPGLPITRWSTEGGDLRIPTSSACTRCSCCRCSAGGWGAGGRVRPPRVHARRAGG